jgi:DNA-binding PadR family transcriptional regulator
MAEPAFFILAVLAQGSAHGYMVISGAKELSGGRVNLQSGAVYSTLQRLCSQGLISVGREDVIDGRLRRYYNLTDAGAADLADEIVRLETNLAVGKAALDCHAQLLGNGKSRLNTG